MSSRPRALAAAIIGVAVLVTVANAAEVTRVDVTKTGDRYLVETEILVAAPIDQVFGVLTDFEQLAELSGAIKESRVERRIDATQQLVFTRVKGCALVFCRTVERMERVQALYPCEVTADLVDGHGDLASSHSYWRLSPSGEGTRLHFSTEVEPLFWVPGMIGERVLKRMVMKTVLDSMDTAEQRAAGGG